MEGARNPLDVLSLTVSADGSDATLTLRVDEKPTTAHWVIEAESRWLSADREVFEEPIVQGAEDVNGSPSTRVVSCTLLLSCVFFHVGISYCISVVAVPICTEFRACLFARVQIWQLQPVHSNNAHMRIASSHDRQVAEIETVLTQR